MACRHLAPLENALNAAGVEETFRGKAWSNTAGVWIYFACVFDMEKLAKRFDFPDFVKLHDHRGTHDGAERGFICDRCGTGVMGVHPDFAHGLPDFDGWAA